MTSSTELALQRRLDRERRSRLEAERLLEEKSNALYQSLKESTLLTKQLRQTVGFQTRELLNAQRVARVGTFIWDVSSEHVTWSDGVYSILGIDPAKESLSVTRYISAVHPDDQDRLQAQISEAIETGFEHYDEFHTTHRIIRADGKVRWIQGVGEITTSGQNSATFMFAAVQDITKLKRANEEVERTQEQLRAQLAELEQTKENLLAARDEAQSANLTKSRFIAMISHEIRTPINGLLGTLNLLQDTKLDDKQEDLLRVAASSADTLRVLLNDVIDFARLETDEIQLEPADFHIRELANQLVNLWRPQAGAQGNKLSVEIDDSVPDFLRGDPTRIGQIMNNLLSNAVKFTKDGDIVLRITSESAALSNNASCCLRIEVTDSGIGISRQDQAGLFREFSQVAARDASSGRSFDWVSGGSGAGLGLAICRALVDQMGGRISVVSAPGEGSTFCVRLELPVAGQPAVEKRGRAEFAALITSNNQKPRALIAEDVPANQLVVQMLLERFGCTVDIAEDGVEAVAACCRRGYDFILMDVSMPRLDGVSATAQIRSLDDEAVAATPIIGLTAFALTDELEKLRVAGMDRVISKPVHRETLYETINSVLHSDANQEAPSTSAAEQHAVSFSVLQDLTKGFSDEQVLQVFEQVSDDLDKHRKDAIQSARNGNVVELSRSCHAVKGLASSFGGDALASLAQQIEAYATKGDGERAFAITLDRFDATTNAALAAFDDYAKSIAAQANHG